MCGIAGLAGPGLDPREARALVLRMTDRIAHRGPDGAGVHEAPGCVLGHRRLSIIDLAGGQQPMLLGELALVQNGEIYDYRELREELRGHGRVFTSESDTEVILHAYAQWGVAGFSRLNGMFAFALHDRRSGVLHLVRDPLGMKPLYYAVRDGVLAFASEVKALLVHPAVRAELDARTLLDFATFQNTVDEKTFFRGVTKLLPGQRLEAHADGRITTHTYWDLELAATSDLTPAAAQAEYRAALERAVRRHLASDVEVGSYLSGGFDSSSVALFASRALPYRMKTFTGFFGGGTRYDERAVTREFERVTGVQGHEVEITARHMREHLSDVVWHLDEPTLGSGALPQWVVAREVARHVKVVLTGHGGDELFGGYPTHQAAWLKDQLRRPGPGLLSALTRLRASDVGKVAYFLLGRVASPELRFGMFNMFGRRARRRLFTPELLASVAGYDPAANLEEKHLRGRRMTATERTLYLYVKTYLPTLFIQEDKVGMAHSIEGRMPICDAELVRLAARLPASLKLGEGLKSIPRGAMKDLLPLVHSTHPKMGFPTPIAAWFKGELYDLLEDVLGSPRLAARGVFEPKAVTDLLRFHRRWGGEALHDYARANQLYSLLAIELWFRRFVDEAA